MKRAFVLLTLIALASDVAPSSFGVSPRSIETPDARASLPAVEDERGLVALDQTLRALTNPYTVACIAAHPDDVDEDALAYYRKNLGARTVIVFATRGEGGESATRGEVNQELGLVRTREALNMTRLLGADAFFLNLRDFGYSKFAEEAFSVWGKDEALAKLVRAIRLLRPDVIITNHDAKSGDGQRQAIARLALEAFNAAADAKVAPTADSEAWQARRLFQRSEDAGAADASIKLDGFDSARGRSYAGIAAAARLQLESYGAKRERPAGNEKVAHYKLVASIPGDTIPPGGGLLDGITLPEKLARSVAPPRVGDQRLIESIAAGDQLVEALRVKLIEKRAEGTPNDLRERYGTEFSKVIRFTETLERALVLALGLSLEITIPDRVLVPRQKFSARVVARNGGGTSLPIVFHMPEQLAFGKDGPAYKQSETLALLPGGTLSQEVEYEIAKDAPVTLPRAAHLYDEEYYPLGTTLPGAQPIEAVGNRLIVTAEAQLELVTLPFSAAVRFDIAPVVEISTIPFAVVKDWDKPREIEFPVRVRNYKPGGLDGALWVVPLALNEDDYEPAHISFAREDEEVTVRMKLRLPILKPPLAPDVLIEFRREKPAPANSLASAKIAVKAIDFEVADNTKVGYIRGPDSSLDLALTELGVAHSELTIDSINGTEHGNGSQAQQTLRGCADLTRFDTIIIDRLAFMARPETQTCNRCLLRFVRQGGNLVVLYQQPDDWGLILTRTPVAPFPVKLSKNRITLETATVKVLAPDHLLMSKPNKITAKDFEGWVGEQARYVPREWSADYTALLESGDAGEEAQRGGLLVARYGEGSFIYTTYNWHRQLLAANRGAYRMLANMISLPKVSKAETKPQ
ncbi:MAG TPA: PIG-L family deacetylase [Blastocatellia bacterium]|nr:PIG-L family deacetylase [Blastocatellia bacterium]